MTNIGIIGRARVGKDTAGAWLVENRGYARVSFADPIKEAALKLDPIINTDAVAYPLRLSRVVELEGWERAKDVYPEVRRILQEYGMTIRAIDPDFWLRAALDKVTAANAAGRPVVITDVRFPNEAESLRRAGVALLYIGRPGVPLLDHESEGGLTPGSADHLIVNSGTLADLHREVWLVADRVARQSRESLI